MSALSRRDGRVFVAASAMQSLITTIFEHAGCSAAEAARIGSRLTGANLRGHDSHGVIRTPRYLQWLGDGKVVADQRVTVERENAVMAVFGGALTGTGTTTPTEVSLGPGKRRVRNGMLSIYMSVAQFQDSTMFSREVRDYINFMKSSRPDSAGGEVLVPGEKERQVMDERSRSGLPLAEQAWNDTLAAGVSVGVAQSDIDAILNAERQ